MNGKEVERQGRKDYVLELGEEVGVGEGCRNDEDQKTGAGDGRDQGDGREMGEERKEEEIGGRTRRFRQLNRH